MYHFVSAEGKRLLPMFQLFPGNDLLFRKG